MSLNLLSTQHRATWRRLRDYKQDGWSSPLVEEIGWGKIVKITPAGKCSDLG